MPTSDVTMRDVYSARQRIVCIARRTPLVRSPWRSPIGWPYYRRWRRSQPESPPALCGCVARPRVPMNGATK